MFPAVCSDRCRSLLWYEWGERVGCDPLRGSYFSTHSYRRVARYVIPLDLYLCVMLLIGCISHPIKGGSVAAYSGEDMKGVGNGCLGSGQDWVL